MSRVYAYERDPYLRQLDVEVLEVGEEEGRPWAILDDTVLYPEGGGQPADRGRLRGVAVVGVRWVDERVRHELESSVPPGSARLELDWERRYDHMQQHTAQHLLSSIALSRFGWATKSFHIGPQTCDIELGVPPLSPERLEALEEAVAEVVAEARPISARRVSREDYERLEVRSRGLPAGLSGDVRLVEIEGVDLNTCGGTHLHSTAEVGLVKLLSAEPLRGGCRLHWVAGRRARRRMGRHEARSAELRKLFDAGDEDLPQLAALKLAQLGQARRRVRQLEAELADAAAEGLAAREEPLVDRHFDDADAGFLQRVARAFLERSPGCAVLLTAAGDRGEFFLVAAGERSAVDPAAAGRRVAALLGGRGGGSGAIFQGKAGSLAERRAVLEELRRMAEEPR